MSARPAFRAPIHCAAFIAASMFIGTAAAAQQPDAMIEPTAEETPSFEEAARLQVRITPGIWLARLSGSAQLGDGRRVRSFQFEDEFNLRDLEPTFRGEAELQFRQWHLHLHLFDFSTDGAGPAERGFDFGDLSLSRGERARATFDQVTLGVDLGYGLPTLRKDGVVLNFTPMLGVRYIDADVSLEALEQPGSPRRSASMQTFGAVAGARMKVEWIEGFEINTEVNFGGTFDGGFLAGVNADLTWYPNHGNIGITLGYRLQYLSGAKDDDFELTSRIAGLFLAGSIRF